MIAIINQGGDMSGECEYRIQINNELITTFKHSRPDGLAECLRKAADAVEKEKEEKKIRILEQIAIDKIEKQNEDRT